MVYGAKTRTWLQRDFKALEKVLSAAWRFITGLNKRRMQIRAWNMADIRAFLGVVLTQTVIETMVFMWQGHLFRSPAATLISQVHKGWLDVEYPDTDRKRGSRTVVDYGVKVIRMHGVDPLFAEYTAADRQKWAQLASERQEVRRSQDAARSHNFQPTEGASQQRTTPVAAAPVAPAPRRRLRVKTRPGSAPPPLRPTGTQDAGQEGQHVCMACGDRFATRIGLGRHVSRLHRRSDDVETYTCVSCGQPHTFATPQGLATHLAALSRREAQVVPPPQPPKEFQCEECDYSSATRRGLTIHVTKLHKRPHRQPQPEPPLQQSRSDETGLDFTRRAARVRQREPDGHREDGQKFFWCRQGCGREWVKWGRAGISHEETCCGNDEETKRQMHRRYKDRLRDERRGPGAAAAPEPANDEDHG